MRIIKRAIFILFILSLLSCASSNGPLFIQEPTLVDSGPCLYIYRPDSTYLQAAKWEFLIDKTNYITLTNGTYAKITIAPGRHEVVSGMSKKIGQPPQLIIIEAVKGKNIYVKYEIRMESNVVMSLIDKPKFNNILSDVGEDQALLDLKNLRLTTVSGRSN